MAKTLWLLRHFDADPTAPGGGDRERPLSHHGRRRASGLHHLITTGLGHELPDRVLVSPAQRTKETAELTFGDVVERWTESRLYAADPDEMRDLLGELDDELTCVAVVGHNPTIHEVSRELLAKTTLPDGSPMKSGYPPGTLSIVELPISSWSDLSWGEGSLLLWCSPED